MIHRRQFLKLGAAASASWALPSLVGVGCGDKDGTGTTDPKSIIDGGRRVAWRADGVPESAERFPQAVVSGAMTASSFMAATRAATDGALVLRVWRPSDNPAEIVWIDDIPCTPNGAGHVRAFVEGLAPDTEYHYAFLVPGADAAAPHVARAAVGKVRTALGPNDKRPLLVAASTCTNQKYPPLKALSHMAAAKPDLFVHLGDMCYHDNTAATTSKTFPEYNARWGETLSIAGMRDILGTTGLYLTWDDHEVRDNWNPETLDPAVIAAATESMVSVLPVEMGPGKRFWRSYRWGRTAEFFVLDCRSERKPSTRSSDRPIYISEEQMTWLKKALSESPAVFKIVLNSVPMVDFPQKLWGNAFIDDRWEGYGVQRRELLDHIHTAGIANVWFLSGDFHLGYVGRCDPEGPSSKVWEIAVGPGGSDGNPLTALAEEGLVPLSDVFPPSHFLWGSGNTSVSTLLTLDPDAGTVRILNTAAATGEVLLDVTMTQDGPR